MAEPKHEPFALTKGDADVVSQDGLNASTDFGWIWRYRVPSGIGLIILPGHTVAVYLHGDDNVEMPATTRLQISVKDTAMAEAKPVLLPTLYQSAKEFTDRDRICRLNVTEPVKVYERQYLVIESAGADVAGTGGVDQTGGARDSYFEMNISRVRMPL